MSETGSATSSAQYPEGMQQWFSPINKNEVSGKNKCNRTDLSIWALSWVVLLVRVAQTIAENFLSILTLFGSFLIKYYLFMTLNITPINMSFVISLHT
jgi:hypothetical protein